MKTGFQEMTDSEWQFIENILNDKRKRKHCLRTIINAIFWIVYSGSQWRCLDSKYPNYQSVYYHFTQFIEKDIWSEILSVLVERLRVKTGREKLPSLLAIDSQSVKTVQFTSESTGIDGNKKINGRKRTIFVDKLGLPLVIHVTAANISDNEAGVLALKKLEGKTERLKLIAADKGYKSTFVQEVQNKLNVEVEIAQKPESSKGFVPEKNRWQVERAFSYLNFRRRLFKDVEKTVKSSEAMITIAYISLIISHL
jgi:putative transposase